MEPWLDEYPEDADAWSVTAAAWYELDRFENALLAAEQAVRLKPESARNWCNLGMMQRKVGQLYEAERSQHKALAIKSDHARARNELRKIHELRTGDRTPEKWDLTDG